MKRKKINRWGHYIFNREQRGEQKKCIYSGKRINMKKKSRPKADQHSTQKYVKREMKIKKNERKKCVRFSTIAFGLLLKLSVLVGTENDVERASSLF